ncbi:hypothetical protein [Streptomyces sp. NPDC054783]
MLSALVVFVCHVRERRSRELKRARSVAEMAQLVLLRPPRRRIGRLRVTRLYLTAEDETRIGDVRGKDWPPSVRRPWGWAYSARARTDTRPCPKLPRAWR